MSIRPITSRLSISEDGWNEVGLPMCAVLTPLEEPEEEEDANGGAGGGAGANARARAYANDDTFSHPLATVPKCLHCGASHPTSTTHFRPSKLSSWLLCYLCGKTSSTMLTDQQEVRDDEHLDPDTYDKIPFRSPGDNNDNDDNDDDEYYDDETTPITDCIEFRVPIERSRNKNASGSDSGDGNGDGDSNWNWNTTWQLPAMACPPVWWIVVDGTVGAGNNNNNNNNNGPSNTTKQQPVDPFLRLDDAIGTGGAVEMSPEVIAVNRAATSNGQTARTYLVNIPNGINPGDKFRAKVDGQQFEVTCPPNASSGMKVRIVAPAVGIQPESNDEHKEPLADPKLQVFEVIVPNGVRPNQPFTLMANGQRVLVTCPPNVYPGSKIRFQLPVPLDTKKSKAKTRLAYKDNSGSSGWERTIRLKDMKFQWVRMEDEGDNEIDTNKRMPSVKSIKTLANMETFDFGKAAYVRKIQYLEGNDARMRTGSVTLVPAQEGVVDSKYVDKNYHGSNEGRTLLSYTDIESVQSQCLDKKIEWFRKSICEDLFRPWEQGHVKIVVQRHALLRDSVDAVLALGRDDMRKRWRIEFLGEPGIEAGGLTREWFQLVTEQIFDPDFGLWQSSENNQMSMNINPASHVSCPDDYLKFFRFLGRVMGRALFDGQLIKGHMARYIYKHLLGWPITFDDLEAQDEEYYNSLKKLTTMKEDVSLMCLGFTVTEETLGVKKEIEMVPGGSATEVDSENLPQYLEASLKYRMLNRCKPQITELMLGFFDIIPEPALTVFDPNELELILCGLPTIDMDDWINNTGYSGYYEAQGKRNRVVKWFWEVVRHDFDQEMKARLLQFVTGTSGVPPRGFSVLQGNDGNLKKFSINGVSRDQYAYPRAHTCFNRIDLPNYSSKQELREKVSQAVSMTYVGFDIE